MIRSRLRALRARLLAARARRELASARRLHLGCGPNLLTGWANVDLRSAAGVVELDLAHALPVADDSVELIYSEHFIEHLDRGDGERLLRECRRVLKPGGRIRISTPDLQAAARFYLEGRTDDWQDVGWHPETPCRMLNEA